MREMQYRGGRIPTATAAARRRSCSRRVALGAAALVLLFVGFSARPSHGQETPPVTAPITPPAPNGAALPVREFTVDELAARAIARSQLGLPGGMVIAVWSELARENHKAPRYSTRFLWNQQKTFEDYPGFLKRFSHTGTEPEVAQARVLLLSVHAAHGLGFQVASPDINTLQIPAEIDFDQFLSPLEFVSMGRVRADLGDKYALIILGQCQPRACLRFQDGDIPVGKELIKQIRRLSGSNRQLSIVRNPHENVYMVGTKVVLRESYTPPSNPSGELAKVVTPDLIGAQIVHKDPLQSTMTDVWILSGHWTDKPVHQDADEARRPTAQMVALAEQKVREAMDVERKEALARGIHLPDATPASVTPPKPAKSGG